jgi:cellulose synthase/poly-beta-1,6-N-acetylglucosamine synthase-like glycosyltransferase
VIAWKLAFFGSIAALVYVYAGYPLLVSLLSFVARKRVRKEDSGEQPSVTVLIAAYNEARNIGATIENKLELDYPPGKLRVFVVSDGSTDGTDDIVRGYESRGVRLKRQEPRQGKTAGLNAAMGEIDSDVVVFSDANSIYEPDTVRKLVRNFSDPTVGYVTGKMIYHNPDGSGVGDGCSTYMKYENFLRRMETETGSVVGVDGGVDAVRRSLYRPMRPDQLPDFVLPLTVVEQGYRVVYEEEAVLVEPVLKASGDEYKMRVRVSLRALWALKDMHHLLSFTKYGAFAWKLWSHKVLRYLCFLFLILCYASNLMLWREGAFYGLALVAQTAAYLVFVIQVATGRGERKSKLLYLINYFVLLNLASGVAFVKFLSGKKQVLWTPRKG